jgi:hypothetical protein
MLRSHRLQVEQCPKHAAARTPSGTAIDFGKFIGRNLLLFITALNFVLHHVRAGQQLVLCQM